MKEVYWLGSSRRELMRFPKDVIQEIGYAIYHAQLGERYRKAKPFKGCGPGVYEIATEHDKNAYRAIYTVNISDGVYVVHCFQKKSKQGIKTPKEEVELIKKRLTFLKSAINNKAHG